MADAITVENVVKRYGDNYALRNVGCRLDAATVTAVVGPNGAGKTTLIDVITGFITPDSGEICLGHRRITGLKPHEIARAGVVRSFQEVRLMRSRACLDNVRLAFRGQPGEDLWRLALKIGVARREADVTASGLERLNQLGLRDLADRDAASLSYGQQKLLAVACCLATDANVIVLDEPFAGLAPHMRSVMGEILAALRVARAVVVFVDHNMEAVRNYADRILVMRRGEFVAAGGTAEVLGSEAARRALSG